MSETPPLPKELHALRELETELFALAKDFRVLGSLGWPRRTLDEFLASWQAGDPRLPEPPVERAEGVDERAQQMEDLMRRTPREHPIGDLLWKTAWSYATAARMLASTGTPAFVERSIELYGRPDKQRPTQDWSDLDAAEFLLAKSADLLASTAVPDVDLNISAEDLAERLLARIRPVFPDVPFEVVVTPELASKAAAASSRVRLREGALFSELDLDQLFQHEVMVHSATLLNGQAQPHFRILGLGSPRTTRTQEGIATAAELMTGSMDLMRLRRIALRVRAVSMALDGADFLDLFRMFLAEGQSEEESAQSAARVFRGGDPRGKIAFTKDGAYIGGLFEVHTFLRLAVRDGRPELIPHLFAGRLTLGDAVLLDDQFQSGVFVAPKTMPRWASDLRRLTATMTYSAFLGFVDLGSITVDRFPELDKRSMGGSAAAEEVLRG